MHGRAEKQDSDEKNRKKTAQRKEKGRIILNRRDGNMSETISSLGVIVLDSFKYTINIVAANLHGKKSFE